MLRKGRGGRRVGARKGMRRPVRRGRRSGNVPDIAKCSVKRTLVPRGGGNFASNTMYEVHNIQLADYDRAVAVAKAYQFFRIKKVKLTYLFPYDTYQQGVGLASRPNFYYMLDKSQAIPAGVTLEALKQMGARPRQVDEKPISIEWSPSVLTEEQTLGGAIPAQYKISPWLNTNNANLGAFVPSAVQHNGLYWYVEQLFLGGTQYEVELEVQFEFKKPLWPVSSSVSATGVQLAPLDNSSDGIVGGPDSNNAVIVPK